MTTNGQSVGFAMAITFLTALASPDSMTYASAALQTQRDAPGRQPFQDVYKTARALSSAVQVGVSRVGYRELLQSFAAAMAVLRDIPGLSEEDTSELNGHVPTGDARIANSYASALFEYELAGIEWDMQETAKREFPAQSKKFESDKQELWTRAVANIDQAVRRELGTEEQ